MQECISISKRATATRFTLTWLLAILIATSSARAADAPAPSGDTKSDRTAQPEEEDYSNTPFTEYGEFNEDKEEEADTRFFQHGRFFGVSIGIGYETVDGNRGLLWQGGFPAVEAKFHYWFDFNFAMDLGFGTTTHIYAPTTNSTVSVSLVRFGLGMKYYFDVKNLAAPISFANPFVSLGGGSYTKTEFNQSTNNTDVDTGIGLNAGAGLEFALSPRKTSLQIEGKIHVVQFKDTNSSKFSAPPVNLPNLTGNLYTLTASFLYTW